MRDIPVYVTRPKQAGASHFELNIYVALALFMLIVLNIGVWSVIGLIEAVRFFA